MKWNVFDKPNDQNEIYFSFGMAKKRPHEMERFRSARRTKSNLFVLCRGEKTSDFNRTYYLNDFG